MSTALEPAPVTSPEGEQPEPIKLVASVMVGATEGDRYLSPFLDHLMEFCDLVCVRWEAERGINIERGDAYGDRFQILRANQTFYTHEGRARDELNAFTLGFAPTHILSIDADEFIADGYQLRDALQADFNLNGLPKQPTAWSLCMMEIWNVKPDGLEIREDGGWAEHDVPVVWTPGSAYLAPPDEMLTAVSAFTMKDVALACGRIPVQVTARAGHTCTAILHFGWTARHERAPRHQRYVVHDGGAYHNIRHLNSILLPDEEIELWPFEWPARLLPYRAAIEAHAGVAVDPVPLKEVVLSAETRQALELDIAVFGACYVHVNQDGVGARIDPTLISVGGKDAPS